MIKTSRDVKSSLEIARKKKAPSFTQKIEDKMKIELEKEFGPIMPEEKRSEVVEREKEIRAKQVLALNKSRMKILRTKEKARIMQEARLGPISVKPNLKKKTKKLENKPSKPNFRKINLEY